MYIVIISFIIGFIAITDGSTNIHWYKDMDGWVKPLQHNIAIIATCRLNTQET